MKYIGLLTDEQKRGGFFVGQDEDCIYLFRNNNHTAKAIAIFPYETATVKEIRDKCQGILESADEEG